MSRQVCWDDSMLRQNEGKYLYLDQGAVAVSYRLHGHDRVRTVFFVRDLDRLHLCAYETGDTDTLLRLLNAYLVAADPALNRGLGESELN